MYFIKATLLFISLCGITLAAQAESQYPPDDRSQLPSELNNTYLGFGAGYTDIPFSNKNLINGLQATSFDNPNFGLNVFIGHYF